MEKSERLRYIEDAELYHSQFIDMFLRKLDGNNMDDQLFNVLISIKNRLWEKWKKGSMYDIYIGNLWMYTPVTKDDLKEQEERLFLALGMISTTIFTALSHVSRFEEEDGEVKEIEKSKEEYYDDLHARSYILIDLFEKFYKREYRGDKIIKSHCSKCKKELNEATDKDQT